MPTYNQNFLSMMNGHVNLWDEGGEPKVTTENNPSRDTADVRQILTNIVGRGYKSLSDDNIRKDYARLANIVGVTQAQKLVDSAIIFNQNPANKNANLESKVQGYFNTKHADPKIDSLIQGAAKFGDGPVAGMTRSPDVGNQKLSGNYDKLDEINQNASSITDMANKKIK